MISAGTNIGDRKENLERAVGAFDLLPETRVGRRSSVYETQPVGYADQQDFYNIAFTVESKLEPAALLGACLGIEAGIGRVRTIKNGPRIIDLDIIFAEDKKISDPHLTVPHPRYHERRFVLEPLLELFPDGSAYGFDIKKYLPEIKGQDIRKLKI